MTGKKGLSAELRRELIAVALSASGAVWTISGISNGCTYYMMMDALDKIKHLPIFRNQVKMAFENCRRMWKRYERNLLYCNNERFFHVADMTPEVRKKYGNITDEEYFGYWLGLGGSAYQRSRALIGSLRNKYRLSLVAHDVPYADELQYVLTAQAGFSISCMMYEELTANIANTCKIPVSYIRSIYRKFYLKDIRDAWSKAMLLLEPKLFQYELTELEERNITHGLKDLENLWMEGDTIFGSLTDATEEYDDVFRTKGENKKALREIAEMHSNMDLELFK